MVLVTGASGFLGSHLVRHLSAAGVATRALYHRHPPSPGLSALPHIAWQACDLLDVYDVEAALAGVHHIYHCAAIVTFHPSRRKEMMHFNAEGTANLVNQALLLPVCRLVHVSSIAALGRTGDGNKEITEEEEWGESRYNSAYAISKYIAEMEVWRAIGEGLDAVIINPGVILGADPMHGLILQLMKLVDRSFPFYTEGITSWVSVNDVVKAMMTLMASDITAERYIVSAGNRSYRDIFALIAARLNKKAPRYKAGSFITGLAWRLSSLQRSLFGRRVLITRETVTNATTISKYNNSKLLNALPGFAYTPVEDAVTAMAQSFMHSSGK